MRLRSVLGIALVVLAFAGGCDRRNESSLDDIQAKLGEVVGHTPLGDYGSVAFSAPADAEWFVVVPAGATPERFTSNEAFMKAVGKPPAGLLGLAEPSIAFVDGGEVSAIQPLQKAFTVNEVLAKPGRTANGVRFVRKTGTERSYIILSLD